jgi:hypothetical protein
MAAGLGFKNFNTGDVLSAADVNGYLMQGVLVFASAAARDAAITSPQEGQFAFTKDTNGLWYYDGAAWVASGATGDIEGVTAGTGISGGGTSGTVTITNSMATAIDAKGDLIAGTGADTFDKLTVGANNTVLTADSSTATGLKWATPAGGGGKVLQVIYGSTSTTATNSTNTYADTNLTASITPSSATSKVLVFVNQSGCGKTTNNTSMKLRLMRGATERIEFAGTAGSTNNTSNNFIGSISASYLDEPATTSATTYKTQFLSNENNTSVIVQNGNPVSTIILMEIGA